MDVSENRIQNFHNLSIDATYVLFISRSQGQNCAILKHLSIEDAVKLSLLFKVTKNKSFMN